MSQDICAIHRDEIDANASLPPGWYVCTLSGASPDGPSGCCEEAVGPYPTQETAAIAMTTKGGCVWLYGPPAIPALPGYIEGLRTYTWNGKAFIVAPRRPA